MFHSSVDLSSSEDKIVAMKWVALLACLALLATGCATKPPPLPPLAQADIVSMTKAGVPDEEIIRRIDATRTVFHLGTEDVVRLRDEGVSSRVIDYMLETYARAEAERARRQAYYDYDAYYYHSHFFH